MGTIIPGSSGGRAGTLIQKATEKDLAGILAIQEGNFDPPWTRSMLESSLEHPRAVLRVARKGDDLAGYSISTFAADECELLSIAVLNTHRRQGIASALNDDLRREALGRGATQIFLEVRPSNQGARSFYASMGYQEVATRKGYYQDGEDALILKLNLEG